MYKCLGIITALLAFCSFMACFGVLYMLNKLEHFVIDGVPPKEHIKPSSDDGSYCPKTYIVNTKDSPNDLWTQILYLKLVVVLTLIYSFSMMILLRAIYVMNLTINWLTGNFMLLIGCLLSFFLHMFTIILEDNLLFVERMCNSFVLYSIHFIAFNTTILFTYFLVHAYLFYLMPSINKLKMKLVQSCQFPV